MHQVSSAESLPPSPKATAEEKQVSPANTQPGEGGSGSSVLCPQLPKTPSEELLRGLRAPTQPHGGKADGQAAAGTRGSNPLAARLRGRRLPWVRRGRGGRDPPPPPERSPTLLPAAAAPRAPHRAPDPPPARRRQRPHATAGRAPAACPPCPAPQRRRPRCVLPELRPRVPGWQRAGLCRPARAVAARLGGLLEPGPWGNDQEQRNVRSPAPSGEASPLNVGAAALPSQRAVRQRHSTASLREPSSFKH